MKYENGKDIFPEKLLRQIQKYVSGKLVYIPSAEKKKDWGETTGYREYLLKRNSDIKVKFRNGKLEKWVHTYLLSDGHNKEFSDGLRLFDRYFLGPVKMPLNLFKRCCGSVHHKRERLCLYARDSINLIAGFRRA